MSPTVGEMLDMRDAGYGGFFVCSGLRSLARVTPLFLATMGFRSASLYSMNPIGMVNLAALNKSPDVFSSLRYKESLVRV